jgi:cytochrome P450
MQVRHAGQQRTREALIVWLAAARETDRIVPPVSMAMRTSDCQPSASQACGA